VRKSLVCSCLMKDVALLIEVLGFCTRLRAIA
jgi:hypothetical protein